MEGDIMKDSLILVKLDAKYCDYLRKFDDKVPYNYGEKELRPFIGILFEIETCKYFAPLSSPKPKHKRMKNMIDFFKIKDGELGAVNFNNMIPVTDRNYTLVDLNKETLTIAELKYQKLLKEHAEAVKNAREAELNQQQAKRNKKLQQEIDALNYKIELIKAEDKVDEKLKQELLQKQAELQTAKATHKLIRDQAKVERKLAEISAQHGEAERLQQLLNEHQQQVNELSLQNNNSREQLSQLKQTYSEYIPIARDIDAQTKAYQNEVAMAINRLTPHLTQQEQQSLKDITDPTLALQRMIEFGQQRIANRGEYTGRALAVAENIRQVFQHDANLAKIGITLANVQQQLRNNQQEAAFATVPDFETAQVAAPPPEELERRFYTTFR